VTHLTSETDASMENSQIRESSQTRRLTASLLLLTSPLLLFTGCKSAAPADTATAAAVQVVHPVTGSITEDIAADATLAPVAQAALLPKVTAPVKAFYVQRGSHVKAGQLLATLENSDLAATAIDNQGTYTAAKGAYDAATKQSVPEEQTRSRLEVEQAKATMDMNNNILNSRRQLLAQGAIPARDVETARTTAIQSEAAYNLAKQHYDSLLAAGTKASLETAQGNLASAKGKYLNAAAMLSYTEIRTPISGVVTDRPLFPGETPASGAAILTVMDTSAMIAKLHIAQTLAQHLKLGAPATLTVPGIDGTVDAKVSLISPALDPGSTTVEVWLRAPNPDGKLKAGSSVRATLKGTTVPNAMLIPTEAVQRSPEGEGKIVMVVAADGTAHKRNVTIGIQTAETTQILDGLKPEDTVITQGGYGLDDGAKVTVEAPGAKGAGDDEKKGEKE
jgi:RND family efflux transporter MFP subunit